MPLYSEEIIEEVRSRSDIVAVIGARVKLTKKGANYFGCCPFHNEKTPSFSVSPSKQMYYCFGCGAGGNVVSFLMNYENYSFPEAVKQLADRAGITLPVQEMSEAEKQQNSLRSRLLEINAEAARYYFYELRRSEDRRGWEYLSRRGLSQETMRRFGLGLAVNAWSGVYGYLKEKGYSDADLKASGIVREKEGRFYDYFRDRVMFPIMDKNSKVIGFGGRIMGSGEPKYLNSPETPVFDKGRNLYGLNFARATRRPYFLLCEGYMDVIALHQAGIDCAVASLGTALTTGHALLIKRHTNHVILTYDSDGAGVKAAMRAIPILREAGLGIKVLNMRPYKDPDEFIVHEGLEAYEQRIKDAENFFLYQSDVWKSQFDQSDPAARTAYHQRLAEELTTFPDELERENYLSAVCSRHGISPELLRGLVNRIGNRRVVSEAETEEIPDEESLKSRMPKEKEEGLLAAQQMLLSFAALGRADGESLEKLLREDDFTSEAYRTVFRMILREKKAGTPLVAASILNRFLEDAESSKLVAAVFNRGMAESSSESEKSRILTDNLRRLRREGLKRRLKAASSPQEMNTVMLEMRSIDKLSVPEEWV